MLEVMKGVMDHKHHRYLDIKFSQSVSPSSLPFQVDLLCLYLSFGEALFKPKCQAQILGTLSSSLCFGICPFSQEHRIISNLLLFSANMYLHLV